MDNHNLYTSNNKRRETLRPMIFAAECNFPVPVFRSAGFGWLLCSFEKRLTIRCAALACCCCLDFLF